jgi:sugar phosphate isomerase/epimerase
MPSLRFAYSTINWGETPDMAAAFAEIREAGWHAVELFNHSLDWLGSPERVKDALGGLQVATGFGSIAIPSEPKGIEIQKRRIEHAAALGAENYGLVGGARMRQRPPSTEEEEDLARVCEALAVHGAALGVTVAYHPHTACTVETAAEIDRLMARTEVLTLCLDASHIALVDEDPVAHLRTYRERTSYVHLKDWARGAFIELGRGTIGIDTPAFLKELEAQSFPGWVIVEQSRSEISPAESARVNADYVRGQGYHL